jgi:hypothetical protein
MTLPDTSRLADSGVRDGYGPGNEVVMEGVKCDFICWICRRGSLSHGDR